MPTAVSAGREGSSSMLQAMVGSDEGPGSRTSGQSMLCKWWTSVSACAPDRAHPQHRFGGMTWQGSILGLPFAIARQALA